MAGHNLEGKRLLKPVNKHVWLRLSFRVANKDGLLASFLALIHTRSRYRVYGVYIFAARARAKTITGTK